MNSAVPFSSILFDRPADKVERDDPSMFRDLNLDQVFAAAATGRDEYDLMPFFSAPLRDVRAVQYRHQVQRDLEDKSLSKAVADFALRMREMRKSLALSGKLRTRYQKEYWFLDAASVYRHAVSTLADALTTIELSSRGFTGLRAYLTDYVQSAAFTGLAADIGKVTSALGGVKYCINLKGNRAAEMAGQRHQVERSFGKARDALAGAVRARVTLEFAESSDPARALCEYADAHVFGLVALGRHGTGGVLHPRLGHVAETVAKKSGLPLLLLGSQS